MGIFIAGKPRVSAVPIQGSRGRRWRVEIVSGTGFNQRRHIFEVHALTKAGAERKAMRRLGIQSRVHRAEDQISKGW